MWFVHMDLAFVVHKVGCKCNLLDYNTQQWHYYYIILTKFFNVLALDRLATCVHGFSAFS